jgi:hypothetical protein
MFLIFSRSLIEQILLDTGRHDGVAANEPVNHGKTIRAAGSNITFDGSLSRILSCKFSSGLS